MQVDQLAAQFLDVFGFHPALIVDESGMKPEQFLDVIRFHPALIHDESDVKPDHIQKLSFKLTHLYYNL